MYRNVQQSSESQSEASSSAESDMSDINGVALLLGMSTKDVHVDRFRVDRQKLENMIKSNFMLFCFEKISFLHSFLSKNSKITKPVLRNFVSVKETLIPFHLFTIKRNKRSRKVKKNKRSKTNVALIN